MRIAPFLLIASLWSGVASAASPIDGLWLTDDHKGVVRIGACGPYVCGWIVRVLDSGPRVPTRDVNNPNPALRARTILGIPVLTGFRGGGNDYGGGAAYDPKSGRSYRASLRLRPGGALAVTGCVMFICQTALWTRTR